MKIFMKTTDLGVSLMASVALADVATAADYTVDATGAGMHAAINFRANHLGYSFVTGRFDKFTGSFNWDKSDPTASKIVIDIDPDPVSDVVGQHDIEVGHQYLDQVVPQAAGTPPFTGRRHQDTIVDVAIDQGGCVETAKATTHDDPIYEVDGIIHYCVANMPGAVSMTSTLALTNATLPYAIELADKGYKKAAKEKPELAKGINIIDGKITYKGVAEAFNLEYVSLNSML